MKLLSILFLLLSGAAFGQDVITLKKGEQIKSKVTEVSDAEIKYKKFDFQEGPTYTLKKPEVLSIKYSNGEEEVFTIESSNSKKMYIFEPSYNLKDFPEISISEGTILVIEDKRATPPKKSMVKYTGSELVTDLAKIIKTKSGKNDLKVITSKSGLQEGAKAIYVSIGAFDATYYTGAWHTQTRYYIEVMSGSQKSNKEIEALKGAFNTLGISTAKNRLSQSFEEATTQLLQFINGKI